MNIQGLLSDINEDELTACVEKIQEILRSFPSETTDSFVFKYIAALDNELKAFNEKSIEKIVSKELNQFDNEAQSAVIEEIKNNCSVSMASIVKAVNRSFRQTLHCKCFNGIDINNFKRAGLLAYWIVKTHPIRFNSYLPNKNNNDMKKIFARLDTLNEQFAVHIILSTFQDEYKYNEEFDYNPYKKKLYHAIYYRDSSDDYLMLLAESIGREGFEFAIKEKEAHAASN